MLAYQAVLPGGKHAVAFINLDTTAAQTVTFSPPPAESITVLETQKRPTDTGHAD